jgi:CheY-like chemotaxis protein
MESDHDLEMTVCDPARCWGGYLHAAAHELRNPLGPIRTAVFLLKGKGALDPDLEKLRLIIERQTEVLAGLVDRLAEKAEAGPGPLPGRADPEDAAARPGAPVEQQAPTPRPLRVLLVDDDANDRLVHEILLQRQGWTVAQAATGEAGLALALAQRPEVALVDFEMPGMDGPTFATRLRAQAGASPFLVALTGHRHGEAVARAMAAGFDAFLVKGSDPEGLISLLEERRRLAGLG